MQGKDIYLSIFSRIIGFNFVVLCYNFNRFSLACEKPDSIRLIKGLPIKKWADVNTTKSSKSYYMGWSYQTKIAAICPMFVQNSLYVNFKLPISRLRWYLTDLMPAFQRFPRLGAFGGIKLPLICSLAQKSC